MADGSFPGLVSRDRNTNAQTNAIWVRLSDDTNALNFTGTSADVNVTNTVTVSASDLDIRDLLYTQDSIAIWSNTAKDGSGTDYQPIVDADGNLQIDVLDVVPGVGATNLGKAVDSAGGATDTGVAALAIRDDALTTLTPADGDYVRLRTTSTGALWVSDTSSSNTAVLQDDAAFTVGTDYVNVGGYLADETAPDSVDEGDVGAARMTLDRKQLMVLADATTDSQRLAIDATGNAQVDLAAVSVTAVPVSKDSSANSETNPIYVYQTNQVISGNEVHD